MKDKEEKAEKGREGKPRSSAQKEKQSGEEAKGGGRQFTEVKNASAAGMGALGRSEQQQLPGSNKKTGDEDDHDAVY